MNVDWGAVWVWLWPILKQGVIALLVSLLAILGYDQKVESRYIRAQRAKRKGGSS
jgi:hypothetical protein